MLPRPSFEMLPEVSFTLSVMGRRLPHLRHRRIRSITIGSFHRDMVRIGPYRPTVSFTHGINRDDLPLPITWATRNPNSFNGPKKHHCCPKETHWRTASPKLLSENLAVESRQFELSGRGTPSVSNLPSLRLALRQRNDAGRCPGFCVDAHVRRLRKD